MTVGLDHYRTSMLLAVIERKLGYTFGTEDIYLNVAGGLEIEEPAADLGIVLGIVSCLMNRPVPAGLAVFGEVGLSGEIRSVGQAVARAKEAAALGFTTILCPRETRPPWRRKISTGSGCSAPGRSARRSTSFSDMIASVGRSPLRKDSAMGIFLFRVAFVAVTAAAGYFVPPFGADRIDRGRHRGRPGPGDPGSRGADPESSVQGHLGRGHRHAFSASFWAGSWARPINPRPPTRARPPSSGSCFFSFCPRPGS